MTIIISNTYTSRSSAVRGAGRKGHTIIEVIDCTNGFAYSYDDGRGRSIDTPVETNDEVAPDVTPTVEIIANVEAPVAVAPLAPVKMTKKQQLRAFIARQAVSVNDIATEFAISAAAARSLIGDIQREGDKLIVERVEGVRQGFYRYA